MCFVHHSRHRSTGWERAEGAATPQDRPVDATPRDAAPADRPARDPDVRVSQAERDEVAATLARHYADGRLTLGEYEERVASALEARTGADLDVLLTDLPAPAAARASAGPPVRERPPRRAGAPAYGPGQGRPGPPIARIVAVVAVIALASAVGWWALWLLWPALAFTGGGSCAGHSRPAHRDHRATIDA